MIAGTSTTQESAPLAQRRLSAAVAVAWKRHLRSHRMRMKYKFLSCLLRMRYFRPSAGELPFRLISFTRLYFILFIRHYGHNVIIIHFYMESLSDKM